MPLLNDEARCPGTDCPSAMDCLRFTERATSDRTPMSAFYLRREAGDSGCIGFRANRPVSTFEATANTIGRIIHANPAEI